MTIWSDVSFIVRDWLVTLWVTQLHQVTSKVWSAHCPQTRDDFTSDTFRSSALWPYSATQIWCSESRYWNNTMLSLRELNGSANNMGVSRISKCYIIFYQCLAQIDHHEHKYTHTSIYIYWIYIYIYIYTYWISYSKIGTR